MVRVKMGLLLLITEFINQQFKTYLIFMDETKQCFGPLNGRHISVVVATRRVYLVVNI